MSPKVSDENFVTFSSQDVLYAAQSMIAVSSMVDALVSEYANTGVLAVGALQHCGNVVDNVIERLGLAEMEIQQTSLPF